MSTLRITSSDIDYWTGYYEGTTNLKTFKGNIIIDKDISRIMLQSINIDGNLEFESNLEISFGGDVEIGGNFIADKGFHEITINGKLIVHGETILQETDYLTVIGSIECHSDVKFGHKVTSLQSIDIKGDVDGDIKILTADIINIDGTLSNVVELYASYLTVKGDIIGYYISTERDINTYNRLDYEAISCLRYPNYTINCGLEISRHLYPKKDVNVLGNNKVVIRTDNQGSSIYTNDGGRNWGSYTDVDYNVDFRTYRKDNLFYNVSLDGNLFIDGNVRNLPYSNITTLAVNETKNRIIQGSTMGNNAKYSKDGGQTWSDINVDSHSLKTTTSIGATPDFKHIYLASKGSKSLNVSHDYGQTWTDKSSVIGMSDSGWGSLRTNESGKYVMYSSTSWDMITAISSDYGETWRILNSGVKTSPRRMSDCGKYMSYSEKDGSLYKDLYYSTDYGQSFNKAPFEGIVLSSTNNYMVALCRRDSDMTLWITRDRFKTFSQLTVTPIKSAYINPYSKYDIIYVDENNNVFTTFNLGVTINHVTTLVDNFFSMTVHV